MRILLITNAETKNHTDQNERVSEVDPDITEMGIIESAKVGKFLKENGFTVNKCNIDKII